MIRPIYLNIFLLLLATVLCRCGQSGEKNKSLCSSKELLPFREHGKWGYINTDGNICIPAKFEDAERFSHGLAKVRFHDKFGFIDSTGNFIIPAKYNGAGIIEEKNIIVSTTDKFGVIDLNGNKIVPELYDELRYNEETKLFIFRKNDSVGIVNERADVLFKVAGRHMDDFHCGRASFAVNYLYGFVDKSGVISVEHQFDWVGDFIENTVFATKGEWCLTLDTLGREQNRFKLNSEYTKQISKNRIAVYNQGVWSIIDDVGKVRSTGYQEMGDIFYCGLLAVKKDSMWGFVDTSGGIRIDPTFEDVGGFSEHRSSAKKSLVEDYGYIDESGSWAIMPKFHSAGAFNNGVAVVESRIQKGNSYVVKSAYIDQSGKLLTGFEFNYAEDFIDGIARVETNRRMGYIDTSGKYIWREN
jgi:hypothetical protein